MLSPEVISIVVDKNNADYDSRNGCNAIIYTSDNRLILGCSSTSIPKGIEAIGEFAFSHCRNLQRVVVPEGVWCIADGAFEYCIYNHRTTKTNQKYPSVNL